MQLQLFYFHMLDRLHYTRDKPFVKGQNIKGHTPFLTWLSSLATDQRVVIMLLIKGEADRPSDHVYNCEQYSGFSAKGTQRFSRG